MIELQDVGYLKVKVKPAGSDKPIEVDIDLWRTQNEIHELAKAMQNRPLGEFYAAVREMMEKMGIPAGSDYLADQFATKVGEAVLALKNSQAGVPSPGSPASTISTPSS